MRVLVTGAAGQLGRELLARPGGHEVAGVTRADLDVTDGAAVRAAVEQSAAEVVVNAAAWTAVDACEDDPGRAMAVNGEAPGHLAAACAATGATFLQVSTDYVFPGDPPTDDDGVPRPWREDDVPGPLSVYGRSKLAGEEAAVAAHDRVHVVRTAWVAGTHGGNFVRTMLRLGETRDALRVVDDQRGSPTFTPDLVDRIWRIVASGDHGTWHATNSGACTWFELAAATFALAGMPVDLTAQPSSALDQPAPRPAWSVLADTRGEAHGWPAPPHWRVGLAQMLAALGHR